MIQARVSSAESGERTWGSLSRLAGVRVPPVVLCGHDGRRYRLDRVTVGWTIVYLYPDTAARRGEDLLQHQAYATRFDEFQTVAVSVIGISSGRSGKQLATVAELCIPHPLLSDPEWQVLDGLGLAPVLEEGQHIFPRVTLVAHESTIRHVFAPPDDVSRDADRALTWLRLHGASGRQDGRAG